MSQQDEHRTFTPEQQQGMYKIVQRCRATSRYSDVGLKILEADAHDLLAEIASTQALAAAPAATEPAPEAGKVKQSLFEAE